MPYIPRGQAAPTTSGPPKPDPARVYRWLDTSDVRSFGLHLMSYGDYPGWHVIQGIPRKRSEANAFGKAGDMEKPIEATIRVAHDLGFTPEWVDRATNRIMYGELTLADIPIEEAERRRAEARAESLEIQARADEEHLEVTPEMERAKITPFKRQLGDIEDRKAFARGNKPRVSVPEAPSSLPDPPPTA